MSDTKVREILERSHCLCGIPACESTYVIQIQDDLAQRIKTLEKELFSALEAREQAFRYRWNQGKAVFEKEALAEHRKLKSGLASYVFHSRIFAVLTAPVIYLGLIPFAFLDLFLAIFQMICFPAYGIPKVNRNGYIVFDRGHLRYLNSLERINCVYCSYANGLLAYASEVAGRTEQHWCPIKHARRIRAPHSRYSHFFDYGNADRYHREIETVRKDFTDLDGGTAS